MALKTSYPLFKKSQQTISSETVPLWLEQIFVSKFSFLYIDFLFLLKQSLEQNIFFVPPLKKTFSHCKHFFIGHPFYFLFNRGIILLYILLSISFLTNNLFADTIVSLDKISFIESSNNQKAYNANSHATGLYQITPIVIKDYNQFHERKYTLRDMYEPKKAYIVANWYMNSRIPSMLKHFHKQDTLENRLIAYNCGIKCVGKSLPLETKNYIKKYKSIK